MSNLSTNYVITLLQNYRATKRKIEQLRYELEHPARVSPDAPPAAYPTRRFTSP